MKRNGLGIGIVIAVVLIGAIGFVAYRYLAPVRVDIVGEADGVPFTIETIPPTVLARPGEMVQVVYRIQNNELMPISAYGAITIGPAKAQDQIEVFLSQCGGINTYQNSSADNYNVMFRVQPAGLSGSSHLVLKHTFTPSTPR
jgi:cytochrome c oxidase assembly protein Cox11